MITPFNFELFKKRLNLFLEKIEALGRAPKLYGYSYSGTTHRLAG